MLWLILLLRKSYTARTGLWPTDCPFGCSHCGAQCTVRVHAEGFGAWTSTTGSSFYGPAQAYDIAVRNYHALVRSLFTQAACPGCGKFAPVVTSRADHEAAARADSERSRWVFAGSFAGVIALLGLGGAAYDRSGWLALGAALAALACGLLALFVKTPRIAGVQLVHPQSVSFWWNGAWSTPRASYAPPLDATKARTPLFSALTTIGALVLGAGAVTGISLWGMSFQTIYVVSTDRANVIHVRLDDVPLGDVEHNTTASDVSSRSFTVRPGHHVIEAYSSANELIERRNFDVASFDESWVFAPHAKENGACLATIVTTYRQSGAPGPTFDRREGSIFNARWDDLFTSSPDRVTLSDGTTEMKRTALRAFACRGDALEYGADGEPVPFYLYRGPTR